MLRRKTEPPFESSRGVGSSHRNGDGRETYDERLNHILRAATVVIARAGYARASMRAVAREAEVSLAGMYHYFDSKEQMLFLILFRAFNSLLNNLKEKLHGVEEPTEQLRVMVRAHVEYFAANMAELKVCSHELDSLTGNAYEETRRIRHEYYQLTRSIIDRILDSRASDGTLDRHVATMALFGTLNWLYRWYDPRRDRSPSGLAKQITAQFLGGIMGASASNEGVNAPVALPHEAGPS
jgi:AcrR family transcriptional regulator